MKIKHLFLHLSVVAALALPYNSHAQMGNLAVPGMEAGDYDLMQEAAREGLDGKEVGEQASWRNSESRNSGVDTLKGLEEYQELPCRQVEHVVTIAKTGQVNTFLSRICLKDGKWRIAP